MRFGFETLASFALLAAAGFCPAQEVADHEYFSALVGPNRPVKSLGTDGTGLTASALVGRVFGSHWGGELEAFGSTFETGDARGTDFYQKGLLVNAVWNVSGGRGDAHTAFLLLGGGFAHNDFFPDARDGFAPLLDVGAGIVSAPMFGRHVHLRAEARYVHDFSEGGHGEPRLGLGIEVPLFSSRPIVTRAPAPLAPAAPIALPLPAVREVVREVPRPWIDSDGDNVDDEHDRCPATPRAVRADAFGCVIANQRIELTGVEFEHNSARLTPGAQTVLDRVARSLAEIGDLKIEVAGHTDSVGQSTTNLALSSARAESVRQYLVAHGVDASRLGARGYGEYELRATPERSDADRQRNRRVELRLVETGVTR